MARNLAVNHDETSKQQDVLPIVQHPSPRFVQSAIAAPWYLSQPHKHNTRIFRPGHFRKRRCSSCGGTGQKSCCEHLESDSFNRQVESTLTASGVPLKDPHRLSETASLQLQPSSSPCSLLAVQSITNGVTSSDEKELCVSRTALPRHRGSQYVPSFGESPHMISTR